MTDTPQRGLFDSLPVRSHLRDPATSRDAEERSKHARGPQMSAVLALVLLHPARTAGELSEIADSQIFHREPYERRQQVRRRLSDLKLLGQVRHGERRGDEVTWLVTR